MKKYLLATWAVGALLAYSASAWSEGWESEHEEYEGGEQRYAQPAPKRPAMMGQKDYRKECSACHMAYPATFLPARSWVKIMSDLDEHFGENAELDAEDRQNITAYLTANAADRSRTYMGQWINRSIPAQQTPMRITQTNYFARMHHEVPNRLVQGNPKVRSFSNCMACHRGADRGYFDEDSVRIPGVGRWED